MIRLAANHREAINQSQCVWDYSSPSRLNLWLKCPLAWKLRYIDGVKTPSNPLPLRTRREPLSGRLFLAISHGLPAWQTRGRLSGATRLRHPRRDAGARRDFRP